MRIEIDTHGSDANELRATAAYLLTLVGDIKLDELPADIEAARKIPTQIPVPTGTPKQPHAPSAPPAPSAPTPPTAPSDAPYPPPAEGPSAAVPPPPTSNVLPFPSASPASPAPAAPNPAELAATTSTAIAAPALPAEYDSTGMPYDARIHQKGKSKKKDGTWKLQKGIDPELVKRVTAELATRKIAAVAPTPAVAELIAAAPTIPAPPAAPPATVTATVPLPPSVPADSVPVPPAGPTVPEQQSLPVPPAPAVGAVSQFPAFMRKVTEATKAGHITPEAVMQIVQRNGAPNLSALAQPTYSAVIPNCIAELDAALFGK